MEGYKPPKMFAELPRKIQEKHDSGEWLNVEVPTHQDISSSDTRSKDRTKGKSGIRESKRNKREIRSGFSPGDEFFLNQASFTRGEAPDFVVKSVSSDGSIRYFEKGSRVVAVVSQDDFAKMVGVADGAKYDEIRGAKERKIFTLYGDSLLNDLDSVEASEISGEGYNDDQNWLLWVDFMMRRNRLQELVQSYQKQAEERGDTALALRDIVQFAKSMPEEFLSDEQREKMAQFVSHEPVDKGDRDKRAQKPRQKKMRLDDEPGKKSPTKKGAPKRERAPKSEPAVANDTQAPVVENVVAPEFIENVIENSAEQLASYRRYLEEEQRGKEILIDLVDHTNIETVFSYEIDPATEKSTKKKIFLPVSDEAKQVFDAMSRTTQREARVIWVEMNTELETSYLGRKFTLALELVQKTWEEKIAQAPDAVALEDIGKREQNGNHKRSRGKSQQGARAFIPIDPKDTSAEFQPLQEVLHQMIDQRNRLKNTALSGFSKLFDDQLKPRVVAVNKELSTLWQSRLEALGGPVYEGETVKSTELVDVESLKQDAQRDIETFLTRSLSLIDEKLAAKGENFLEIYREDRERAKRLLAAVGGHIVAIATSAAGRVEPKDADALKQAVVKFGTVQLALVLKQRVAGLLELKKS